MSNEEEYPVYSGARADLTNFQTATSTPSKHAPPHQDTSTNPEEKWKFSGHRRASASASDVGEIPSHTTADERQLYVELKEKTKGMTPEQVREYCKNYPHVDLDKLMQELDNDGYLAMTGAKSGVV